MNSAAEIICNYSFLPTLNFKLIIGVKLCITDLVYMLWFKFNISTTVMLILFLNQLIGFKFSLPHIHYHKLINNEK